MPANKVIRSIEAPGGQLCVDLFRRPDGSFGFELYRRDPEDGRGWYPVGHYSAQRFEDGDGAFRAAIATVPWLADV